MQISSLDSSESVFMYQGCIYKQYFQRPIFIHGVHALLGIQVTSPTCAGAGITNALLSLLPSDFNRRQLHNINYTRKRAHVHRYIQPIYPIIPITSIIDMPITDIIDYLGLVYRLYRLFQY